MALNGSSHRICMTCQPPHVENCETCYGFGLTMRFYEKTPLPIRGAELDDPPAWRQCPECGGTPYGIKTIGEE
mgnify:CR=1 FL=1